MFCLLLYLLVVSIQCPLWMLRAVFAGCGGQLTRPGTIETTNFMGKYSEQANCTWNITAPPGHVIVLRWAQWFSQCKIFIGQFIAMYLSKKPHHNLKVHYHVLKCTKNPVLSSRPYSLFSSLIGPIFPETLYRPVEAQFVPYFCMFGNERICGSEPVVILFVLLFAELFLWWVSFVCVKTGTISHCCC